MNLTIIYKDNFNKEKSMGNLDRYNNFCPYLKYYRLFLGVHRNSARSAIWSDDHSGEGRAVSFLKLSSSKSSSNDSTVNESAEIEGYIVNIFSLQNNKKN